MSEITQKCDQFVPCRKALYPKTWVKQIGRPCQRELDGTVAQCPLIPWETVDPHPREQEEQEASDE